jgi:hypothetical protein
MRRQCFALLQITLQQFGAASGPKGFAVDLRHKLGLLVLEEESEADGLIRIAMDQERRTAQRLEGQIKTARERAPKKPRIPKVKKVKAPKGAQPRKRKVKNNLNPEDP